MRWPLGDSWPWWALPRRDAEGRTSRPKPSAQRSYVVVGEAEFGETGVSSHICAGCRHRRDRSNCMGPLLEKLKMTRRGRGDEERTFIEVARCFVLGLARAVQGVVTPTALTQPERWMRRGEEGGRIFPRTTHVYCTSPDNSIKKVRQRMLRTKNLICAVCETSCIGPLALRPSGGHGGVEHCVAADPRVSSHRVPGRASHRPSWATASRRCNTTT